MRLRLGRAWAGVGLAAISLVASVGSDVAGAAPGRVVPVRRTLVISLPAVAWRDLDAAATPHLDGLFEASAIGNLATRAPSLRTDLAAGYATFGAGDKAVSSHTAADGAAYEVGEDVDGEPAAVLFERRTGQLVAGGLVHLGEGLLENANDASLWQAHLGALGDALDADGISRAVIANADGSEPAGGSAAVPRRAAATALMGSDGTVPGGAVSARLLRDDPTAPYGVRLDADAVLRAFSESWRDRSVVLVEASDLVRANAYTALQPAPERAATRAQALVWTDELVGRLLSEVDPAVDAVIVVGPAPARLKAGLTIAALRAPGVRPGLLRSPTTQRSGYVQLMDVAPTIVGLMGVDRPDTMRGRPFTEAASNATTQHLRSELVDGNEAAIFRGEILTPVAIVFTVLVGLLLIAAGVSLVLGTGQRRPFAPLLAAGSIAVLGYVASVYLARLFAFHRIGAVGYWTFLFLGAALFAGITWVAARRRPVDALVIGLGALVALLVGDVVLGSNLQFASGFGFSPDVAGRFIGFGNVSYAVLAASSLLLAGMLAARWPGQIGRLAALGLLTVVAVADGAPFWGADVGGVLTLIPAFVLVVMLIYGIRIRVRTLVLSVAATVVALGLAVAADMSRPSAERTHLGRLVEQVGGEGSSAFLTVVHRKLAMSLATLSSSQWRPMVPIVAMFLVLLVRRRDSLCSAARSRIHDLRAALLGVAVVAVLGFSLNDQGIVVPAVMLGILAPALVVLVIAGEPHSQQRLLRNERG